MASSSSLKEAPSQETETDYIDPVIADAGDLIEKGMSAFRNQKFSAAFEFFNRAHKKLVDKYPIFGQIGSVEFRCGLALQSQFRIDDDLMTEAVPMEADYLVHSTIVAKKLDIPTYNDGIECKGNTEDLDSAREFLLTAWKIEEENPSDSKEKVDILSALGEVALKKGDLDSYKHYEKALSILRNLVEEDNQRIAHLNFKLFLCMAKCNRIYKAIDYCKEAISVCTARIERLTDEGLADVNQAPSSVPVDVGLSLPKKEEVLMLQLLSSEFEKKILILQQQSESLPPPIDSASNEQSNGESLTEGLMRIESNLMANTYSDDSMNSEKEEILEAYCKSLVTLAGLDRLNPICQEIASPDGMSGEQKEFTPVNASNQPGDPELEFATVSTAGRDFGAEARTGKKTFSTDSANNEQSSTPMSTSENSQKYSTPMSAATNQPGGPEHTPPTISTAPENKRDDADRPKAILKTYTRRTRLN